MIEGKDIAHHQEEGFWLSWPDSAVRVSGGKKEC